jgi:hypothetical protein
MGEILETHATLISAEYFRIWNENMAVLETRAFHFC